MRVGFVHNDLLGIMKIESDTLAKFFEGFQNQVEVVEHTGVEIGTGTTLVKHVAALEEVDYDAASSAEKAELQKQTKDCYLAKFFLCGSNRTKYCGAIDELPNNYIRGIDSYPTDFVKACRLLQYCKQQTPRNHNINNRQPRSTEDHSGVSFFQVSEEVAGIAAAGDSDGFSFRF